MLNLVKRFSSVHTIMFVNRVDTKCLGVRCWVLFDFCRGFRDQMHSLFEFHSNLAKGFHCIFVTLCLFLATW